MLNDDNRIKKVDIKQIMGFLKKPALCKNCKFNTKVASSEDGVDSSGRFCRKGNFTIKSFSVCEKWKDKKNKLLMI